METVSAESVQKRTAKSARLLNRLMKKPGGNKAKEKTANADISDVAAIARSALALKKMAVTHNAKAKDHAKKMAEKERMVGSSSCFRCHGCSSAQADSSSRQFIFLH